VIKSFRLFSADDDQTAIDRPPGSLRLDDDPRSQRFDETRNANCEPEISAAWRAEIPPDRSK
jgi:hypothetical protein